MEQKAQWKYSATGAAIAVLAGIMLAWLRAGALRRDGGMALFYVLLAAAVALVGFFAFYLGHTVFTKGKWMKKEGGETRDRADAVYAAAEGVAAALLCLAGLLCLWLNRSAMSLVLGIQAVFLLFCGAAKFLETGKKGENKPLWSLFPVLYLGFALLMFYRANTAIARPSVYAIELFMRVAIMLAIYAVCARYFERAKPVRVLFYGYAAILFFILVVFSFVLAPGHYQGRGITSWSLVADGAFVLTTLCGVIWPLRGGEYLPAEEKKAAPAEPEEDLEAVDRLIGELDEDSAPEEK